MTDNGAGKRTPFCSKARKRRFVSYSVPNRPFALLQNGVVERLLNISNRLQESQSFFLLFSSHKKPSETSRFPAVVCTSADSSSSSVKLEIYDQLIYIFKLQNNFNNNLKTFYFLKVY